MSKKLYLYREGYKPLKMAFTKNDVPILWEYYDEFIKLAGSPEFKDLNMLQMHNIANTFSFSLFRLAWRWRELKQAIKSTILQAFDKTKNFFQ